MKDRRAEVIRQLHEQEVIMRRNATAIGREQEQAIKLGYWVSPWLLQRQAA